MTITITTSTSQTVQQLLPPRPPPPVSTSPPRLTYPQAQISFLLVTFHNPANPAATLQAKPRTRYSPPVRNMKSNYTPTKYALRYAAPPKANRRSSTDGGSRTQQISDRNGVCGTFLSTDTSNKSRPPAAVMSIHGVGVVATEKIRIQNSRLRSRVRRR